MKNIEIGEASSLNELMQMFNEAYGDSDWYTKTLTEYAKKVDTVLEFGTWNGQSVVAFALGNPKKIVSCDLTHNFVNCNLIEMLCEKEKIHVEFKLANSHSPINESYDLIFLDTIHTYHHVRKELDTHNEIAVKYILIHDTNYPPPRKNPEKLVRDAVFDFLEKNNHWDLELEDRTSTGIMILRRR